MPKMKIKNKAGKTDVVTRFMQILFGVVILGFLIIVVAGNLKDAGNDSLPDTSRTISNETLSTMQTSVLATLQFTGFQDCSARCSSHLIHNATTNGTIIEASNYTLSNDGCSITPTADSSVAFNNSDWFDTYTFTNNECSIRDVTGNVTGGVAGFFSNTGTWFNILSVVIIIALVIVVWRKSRGAGSSGGSMSKSSSGDFDM